MATYAIGDVQGCLGSLRRLIDQIEFSPHTDRLWFVGDLVNRGPDSAGVLRYVKGLGPSAQTVLGNHDLYLLAAAENIVTLRPKDTIRDVLGSEDRAALIEWLRFQPLHVHEGAFFMVHAGLLPQWTLEEAIELAREVESALAGRDYQTFLHHLFHGSASHWDPLLKGPERLVAITRVFTRLRTCTAQGLMSPFSGPPDEAPHGYVPWFQLPHRRSNDTTVIAGHWAALGLRLEPDVWAIDSGCIWGKRLTAVRLEDRAVFQVDCAGRPCHD
jgi:bis(5'-nucleosyl)-tetraphosphatase (symmetrical)